LIAQKRLLISTNKHEEKKKKKKRKLYETSEVLTRTGRAEHFAPSLTAVQQPNTSLERG
jgi:hypothetical protein